MGNKFTFMHCADLHLGSRFIGVTDDDPVLGKRMRSSPMESFERIVDAAIERGADFMVVSGDLYDEANVLPSVRLGLCRQLSRFTRPVFIARGNHDSDTSWSAAIPYPDNVYEFPIVPSSVRLRIRGTEVEVVGVSFEGHHDERNLVSLLKGRPEAFTVGCVHCDVDPPSGTSRYAPCSSSDLRGRNIDYWALGHIHKRSVVSQHPPAVYPGCIQGRSVKETGEKGAYLVTVEDGHARMEFIPTQSILWEDITVDITGKGVQDLVSTLSSQVGSDSLVRLRFTGTGELDSLARSEGSDLMGEIGRSIGCTVVDLIVDSSGSVDLASFIGKGDMRSKLVEVGMGLSRDRNAIIDAICMNPVADNHRGFFESMDDDELTSLVESALKRLVSGMEVSR